MELGGRSGLVAGADHGWLATVPEGRMREVDAFMGDICDSHGVRAPLDGIEAVFHVPALIGIPFSYRSRDSYVDRSSQVFLREGRERTVEWFADSNKRSGSRLGCTA